jgi:hypothetical protein
MPITRASASQRVLHVGLCAANQNSSSPSVQHSSSGASIVSSRFSPAFAIVSSTSTAVRKAVRASNSTSAMRWMITSVAVPAAGPRNGCPTRHFPSASRSRPSSSRSSAACCSSPSPAGGPSPSSRPRRPARSAPFTNSSITPMRAMKTAARSCQKRFCQSAESRSEVTDMGRHVSVPDFIAKAESCAAFLRWHRAPRE